MPKHKISITLIIVLIGCSVAYSSTSTDSLTSENDSRLEGIEQVINQALEDNNLPGAAVAVVLHGKVVYAKGFGYRDIATKKPMTPSTLFAIGSTTKAMTATVIGMLVDEGKLTWVSPVRNYLPAFRLSDPVASDRITLRDILAHRSGLPGHNYAWFNNNDITRADLISKIAYLEMNADLRERWQYNNLLYMTAGYLAGQVSGSSWEDLLRERLFEPLNMRRSNFSVTVMQTDDDFAYPYQIKDGKQERIPFRVLDTIGPAGSVNSSVDEMTRWLIINLEGGEFAGKQLISAATLREIHQPQMIIGNSSGNPEVSLSLYCLGWFFDIYRGHSRIWHGGGIDGFSTAVMLFPDDGLGIVSFNNGEFGQLGISALINNCISDRMLGLRQIDWLEQDTEESDKQNEVDKEAPRVEPDIVQGKRSARIPDTHPSHPLAAYVGKYYHPGYGALSIRQVCNNLELTFNGLVTRLEHWHYDVWNGLETTTAGPFSFGDTKFVFRVDLAGQISSIEAALEPESRPIVFTKVP